MASLDLVVAYFCIELVFLNEKEKQATLKLSHC